MVGKTGNVKRAVVLTAALVFIIYLLRRFTSLLDFIGDKIGNMMLPTKTQQRIHDAALQRLERNFTPTQSKRLAKLMVAQAMHETANFTSNVFRNNLNAFGYKDTSVSIYDDESKRGIMSPEGNRYEVYADVADSAREVADWLGRRKKKGFATVKTPDDYARVLKENAYYGDPVSVYASGLNRHFNQLV